MEAVKVTESFVPFGLTARIGAGAAGVRAIVAEAAATVSMSDAVLEEKLLSLL